MQSRPGFAVGLAHDSNLFSLHSGFAQKMEDIYSLIQERNARETLPFLSIHSSNSYLRNHVDTLQARCESLERQYFEQQQLIATQSQQIELSANSVPAKNEAKYRQEIAKLEKEKLQHEMKSAAAAIETSKELSNMREDIADKGNTISNLRMEATRNNEIITHLQSELDHSKSLARLAEQQFGGLKDAIRALQDENDETKKLNRRLLDETVNEKEKMAEQFNNMNETTETLQKEASMLRSYVKMGTSSGKGWFGLSARKSFLAAVNDESSSDDAALKPTRQWGATGAVMPSRPIFTIKAHRDDASCVRYDGTNLNRIATASSDATVKVFDTSNGQLEATFSAGGSQPLIGIDLAGDIVCGCGADKTCRVWSQKTKRMIHQLAGHSQKITCVRLLPGEKGVITGSADRSIRVWDIARHIYTQTTTFRHTSTSNCSDVSLTQSIVSGHLDGGIRCWDLRSGDRVLDIPLLHEGGVTSVQWKPGNDFEILTNGRDSTLKIVDTRTNTIVKAVHDPRFRTLTNHASSSFSPDGAHIAAGSGDNGDVFVWNVASGELEKRLRSHSCGAVGLAWGMGGTNGQQVASIDKAGVLILWG